MMVRIARYLIPFLLLAAAVTAGEGISPARCSVSEDGYVTTWLVCGPFPNYQGEQPRDTILEGEARWGFRHNFLAEMGGETKAAPFEGAQLTGERGKTIAWRAWFSDTRPVILNHATGVGRDPYVWRSRNKVAYAYCIIQSPRKQKVFLKLGHGRGAKVWLNGQQVYEREKWTWLKSDHGLDREVVEVELAAGDNPCLVKVDKTGWEWALGFRIVDGGDEPVKEFRVKLPVKGGGLSVLCREALKVATLRQAYPAGSRPTLHIRMPRQGYPLTEGDLTVRARLADPAGKEAWTADLGTFPPSAFLGQGLRRRLALEQLPPGEYRLTISFATPSGRTLGERRLPLLLHRPWD